MEHNERTDELAAAIASYWGDVDTLVKRPYGYGFLGDEDMSRYTITLPDVETDYFEDSGRPFRSRSPKGKLYVRCIDDAPDCFWYVRLDGTYEGFRESFNVLEEVR